MSTTSLATTKWLKYFAAAGIPSNAAANYAVIFTENRIQPDMLLDLNKEYLYDMGIRVMGDVIAILRYARTAYTEEAQKKILGEASSLNPRSSLTESEKKSQPSLKRTFSSYDTPSDRLSAKIEKPKALPVKKVSNPAVKVKKVVLLKRSVNELDDEDSNEAPPVKPNKIQKLSTKTVTTDKKTVEKNTVVKGSVFRRLGESSVSSSTDSVPVSVQSTSIFERLGPSKTKTVSQPASSTVNESTLNLSNSSKNQSYKGVLKTFTVKREIVNPVAVSITTGAALRGKSNIGSIQLKKTVKNRLGSKSTSSSTVSTTSERIFNTQRRLLQRSLADVESQNRKTVIKLSQRPKPALLKTRLSSGITFNTRTTLRSPRLSSGITFNTTNSSKTPNRSLMSDNISTSERIVKKPKLIFTKPKQSIFSRLGPV